MEARNLSEMELHSDTVYPIDSTLRIEPLQLSPRQTLLSQTNRKSENVTSRRKIPKLPRGKKYHVYLLCSEEDRVITRDYTEVIRNLGYKCAYSQDGSRPYLPEVTCLEKEMTKSVWYGIVFTKTFLVCDRCKLYLNMILTYIADEVKKTVLVSMITVPALRGLRPKSLMPFPLVFTYENAWPDDLDCILRKAPSKLDPLKYCSIEEHHDVFSTSSSCDESTSIMSAPAKMSTESDKDFRDGRLFPEGYMKDIKMRTKRRMISSAVKKGNHCSNSFVQYSRMFPKHKQAKKRPSDGSAEKHANSCPNAKGTGNLDIIVEERTVDATNDNFMHVLSVSDPKRHRAVETNGLQQVCSSVGSSVGSSQETRKVPSIKHKGRQSRIVRAPICGKTGRFDALPPHSNPIFVTASRDDGPINRDLMSRTQWIAETEEEQNMLFFGHLCRNKLPCYEAMKDRVCKTSQELTVKRGDVLKLEGAPGENSPSLVLVSNHRGSKGFIPKSIIAPKHYSPTYSLIGLLTDSVPQHENEKQIYLLNQLGEDAYRIKAISGVRTRTEDGQHISIPCGTVVQIVREVQGSFSKLSMADVRTSRGVCCRIPLHLLEKIDKLPYC